MSLQVFAEFGRVQAVRHEISRPQSTYQHLVSIQCLSFLVQILPGLIDVPTEEPESLLSAELFLLYLLVRFVYFQAFHLLSLKQVFGCLILSLGADRSLFLRILFKADRAGDHIDTESLKPPATDTLFTYVFVWCAKD